LVYEKAVRGNCEYCVEGTRTGGNQACRVHSGYGDEKCEDVWEFDFQKFIKEDDEDE